jgi:sterol desaturase/sphingolipid hydroxylase (fatty acid hydroxylase superfamily)
MDILAKSREFGEHLSSVLLPLGSTFSLASLAFAFCVASSFLALRHWRRRKRLPVGAIARAIFSKRIAFDPSTKADIGYFFINTLALGGLVGWAALSTQSIEAFVLTQLSTHFGARGPVAAPEAFLRACMTLLLFLAYEFGYWADHYLKHKIPALWEFHKTHHTAQCLTPLTVWRVHPVDTLVFGNVLSVVIGLVAGVATYLLGRRIPCYAIDGTNVVLVAFVYAYVHLQHSQFWMPLPGALGRIFLSPAHHQIHHSMDPADFNSNLGSCLAIWDWMFGTLRIPRTQSPQLKFGVEMEGVDPNTITELLISPIRNSIASLAPRGAAPPPTSPARVDLH